MLILAIISGLILMLCLIAIATSRRTTPDSAHASSLSGRLAGTMLIPVFIGVYAVHALMENHALPTQAFFLSKIQEAVRQPDQAALLSALEAAGFEPHQEEGSYFYRSCRLPRITDFPASDLKQSASFIYLHTDLVRQEPRRLFGHDQRLLAEFLFDSNQHLISWHYRLTPEP